MIYELLQRYLSNAVIPPPSLIDSEVDEQVYAELEAQIVELKQAKAEKEASSQKDRALLEAEVARLRALVDDKISSRDQMEKDLQSTKVLLENEMTARKILEQRNVELSAETDRKRELMMKALADATDQAREADRLRQELSRVRSEFEEVKALEARHGEKAASLFEEQARTLRRLEEAQALGENLESQIHMARVESDEVKRALAESRREKDRLLRDQASEHDRLLRDHIAEADGDRAVLEHQYLELKAALEEAQQQLKDARSQAEIADSDGVGLREELRRVELELDEAHHVEEVLREDLRAGRASQSDFELQLESKGRLVAQILAAALTFRESHVKAMSAAQNMISHPHAGASMSKGGGSSSLTDSGFGALRRGTVNHLEEAPPIDPSDPDSALEALRAFDHDHFIEVINKAGSTIRKWQKHCKDYRERAKGKITFRNFSKGDLALFLPTRNSVSKPWAAFNGECLGVYPWKGVGLVSKIDIGVADVRGYSLRQCLSHTTSCKPLVSLLNSSRQESG